MTNNDSDDSGHESDPMSCVESGCIPKDETHVTDKPGCQVSEVSGNVEDISVKYKCMVSKNVEGTSWSHSAGNRMSAKIGAEKQKKTVSPINAKQQECENSWTNLTHLIHMIHLTM